jgi:hypothetical protein
MFSAVAAVFLLAGCGRSRGSETHSVKLSWIPSTSKLVGYYVYREMPSSSLAMRLNPQPIMETRYFDTAVEADGNYIYFVTAVDSKGIESRPSDIALASVPRRETFLEPLTNSLRSLKRRVRRMLSD